MACLGGGSRNGGVAALEFGLLLPVLAVLFVGIVDFSMVYHDELQLASALAAGAQYAFAKGQTESGAALTADVSGFVTGISAIPLVSVGASYNNGGDAGGCYCVTGAQAAYTGPVACGGACADGSTAGKYVTLSAGFDYTPMFAADQVFFTNPLMQSVTVRLQ